MKHVVSYTVLASLLWGNVAQAGKDFMDAQTEDAPIVRTVRPVRHNTARELDQLFFHVAGQSIEISGSDGQIRSISKVNVDRSIRETMAHSPEALDAFLKHNTFSVKEADNGDLVLHLNGALKGGMYGGGQGNSFCNPNNNVCVGGGYHNGQLTFTIQPKPVSNPGAFQPSSHLQQSFANLDPCPGNIVQQQIQQTIQRHMTQRLEEERLQHEKKQAQYQQYLKDKQIYDEQIKKQQAHEKAIEEKKLQVKKQSGPFYEIFDAAETIRNLINTSSWENVYAFADKNGVSRETVAYINQNRGMLDFKDYMLKTNVTYASFNRATTIQKLINTDTWDNVYAYAEKNGITKQQVKEIDKRRTENLSTSLMTENVRGEVAYDDPLMPNGLVYPVKQTKDMDADAFLPKGYKPSLQDQSIGEALLRGFGKGVDKLLCATIGACDAQASPARLAMEVVKHGPAIINMADKAWKTLGATIGLSATTQYKNKQKTLVTDIVDWLEAKPKIESYPLNENEKYDLLVTEGIIGEPQINITPVGNKLDIKLTTPVIEDGIAKYRLIHMQITKDDIDFVERAGLKGPVPADGDGLKWADGSKGNRAIRIMNGLGDKAQHESQKDDYVKVVRNGQMLKANGEVLTKDESLKDGFPKPRDNPRSHINKKEWLKWKHPLQPSDPTGGIK